MIAMTFGEIKIETLPNNYRSHTQANTAATSAQDRANALIEELRQQLADSKVNLEKADNQLEAAREQVEKSGEQMALARKEREEAVKEAAELRGKASALETYNKELLARRLLESENNLYGQLYWSRITVMGGGVHVFTPSHVYDCSPDGGWKIITLDAPPVDHWQIVFRPQRFMPNKFIWMAWPVPFIHP